MSKRAISLTVLLVFVTVAPALAFWEWITFGMWLFKELQGQTVREQGHEGTVSFLIHVPTEFQNSTTGLGTDIVLIKPTRAGETYRLVQGWTTEVRFWSPRSGHDIRKLELYRGFERIARIEGDEAQRLRYLDVTLPADLGTGPNRGKAEHFEAVLFLGNGERVSIFFSVIDLTLDDWHGQYELETKNKMGQLIAGARRQTNPARTAVVEITVPESVGLWIIDTVGDGTESPDSIAEARKFGPGIYRIKVKPGQVWIRPDQPGWTADIRPNADGSYAVPAEGFKITLKRVGGGNTP